MGCGLEENLAPLGWAVVKATVVKFHFLSALGFFPVFHSKPRRPDWQMDCLLFLVWDSMLFLKAIPHLLTCIHLLISVPLSIIILPGHF